MWEDIRTFAPVSERHPLVMELCGVSYCNGSYFIHRSCSTVWVIEYIVEGTGTVILDGDKYVASAGDVYMLPAKHEHNYYSDSDHPWTKLFFNASGTLLQSLAVEYGLTGKVVFKSCPVENLFRALIALTEKGLPAEELLSQCTLQVHRIFMALFQHSLRQDNEASEAYLLKEYIDSKITGNLAIDDLSKLLHRSEDYVINLFKSTFFQTPYAYYLEQKMELAKTLLANTNMPIGHISSLLGFEDSHYFSNRFRCFMGQSPSTFRKHKSGTKNEEY